jgi:hypothetical protein
VLGRRETTGIKLQSVSRALCEVSFSRVSRGGVCSLDDKAVKWESPDAAADDALDPAAASTDAPNKPAGVVAYLSMRKAPRQHSVHIDGVSLSEPLGRQIELKDGQIISLWGPLGFAYLVQFGVDPEEENVTIKANVKAEGTANVKTEEDTSIINCKDTTNQKSESGDSLKRKAPPSPSPHQEIRKRSHQLMVGEQTCALCMDILIKSTFAYPW